MRTDIGLLPSQSGRFHRTSAGSMSPVRQSATPPQSTPQLGGDHIHCGITPSESDISQLNKRSFDNKSFRKLVGELEALIAGGTLPDERVHEIAGHVLQAAADERVMVNGYINRDFPHATQALNQYIQLMLSARLTIASHQAALRNFAKALRVGHLIVPKLMRGKLCLLAGQRLETMGAGSLERSTLAGIVVILNRTKRPTRRMHRRKAPHPSRSPAV